MVLQYYNSFQPNYTYNPQYSGPRQNAAVYSDFTSAYHDYGYPLTSYQNNNNNDGDLTRTAGLAALLQLIASGLQKGSSILSAKLSAGKEFTTADNVVSVAQDMVRKNHLNVETGYIDHFNKGSYSARFGQPNEFEVVARGQNAFYADELKLAVAPKSKPSLILHELGHAINAKGTFTRLLQKSRRYAGFAPMALLLADRMTKDRNSGEKSFIEKYAGTLGFCAFLPTIIEEGLASFRGIQAAKAKLGNIPNLNILKKNYAIALGTYILAGIGLGVAAKQTIVENKLNNR